MNDTMSLSAWLRLRIFEDRVVARDALAGWVEGADGDEMAAQPDSILVGAHLVRWEPKRVLLDCDAKERLVYIHSEPHTIVDGFCVECGGDCTHDREDDCMLCGAAFTPCQSLRLLTMGLTERSGFREEWRAFSDRPRAASGGQP